MFYHRPRLRTLPEELVYISQDGHGILLYVDPVTDEGLAYPVLPIVEARQNANTYPTTTIGELQGYHQLAPAEVHGVLNRLLQANWRGEATRLLNEFRAILAANEPATALMS